LLAEFAEKGFGGGDGGVEAAELGEGAAEVGAPAVEGAQAGKQVPRAVWGGRRRRETVRRETPHRGVSTWEGGEEGVEALGRDGVGDGAVGRVVGGVGTQAGQVGDHALAGVVEFSCEAVGLGLPAAEEPAVQEPGSSEKS
jgi:hypothetical protein